MVCFLVGKVWCRLRREWPRSEPHQGPAFISLCMNPESLSLQKYIPKPKSAHNNQKFETTTFLLYILLNLDNYS